MYQPISSQDTMNVKACTEQSLEVTGPAQRRSRRRRAFGGRIYNRFEAHLEVVYYYHAVQQSDN